MKQIYKILIFSSLWMVLGSLSAQAQFTLRGKLIDDTNGEALIGATVAVIQGGTGGGMTNYDGEYSVKVDSLPAKIRISYTGYTSQEVEYTSVGTRPTVRLTTGDIMIEEAVVRGQRIDDKQKSAPLTVENLDAIAIRETAAVSFYNGLGNLKGVDLTTASLGFTIINTRGFNSTSPVRSLQIIDGVDNQAPGLNFSLGNFLGACDLDVQKVDIIVGASSAFYGPNAFNGVISMKTKNPFINKGLSVSLKSGERNLLEGALRYADAFKNKKGQDFMAFKFNFFGLRANDWEADNYDAVTGTTTGRVFETNENPGRHDGVNIYGDETSYDFGTDLYSSNAGLNTFHRSGYKETDLVDYNTRNLKSSIALHFRTKPSEEFNSPEFIVASNFGTGTTVYQGDNRFSLRNILFFQERLEFAKTDKYFIRAYATFEDAGDSYDPYFTALKLQQAAKTDDQWRNDYRKYWVQNNLGGVFNKLKNLGYGEPDENDTQGLIAWQQAHRDVLVDFHNAAEAYANSANPLVSTSQDFYTPGTARFDSLFNSLVSRKSNAREGGTSFYDKSALYHVHGEYHFSPSFLEDLVVGANYRLYRPSSDGTIFSDTNGVRITNQEWGAYVGAEKQFGNFKLNGTVRVDKNENFHFVSTPALSVVYNPSQNNYLRVSFSSAIRNPTLTDQYLNLNVGRATLIGNLNGFDDLITIESFNDYRQTLNPLLIKRIDIAPIQPEKVKTFELGYRTTLFNRIYTDIGYYYSIYNDFIGYNIGLTADFNDIGLPENVQVWRIASNADKQVTTQGASIGLNYFFRQFYMISGNYSWNKLITKDDDPIIPAFNTPEHKYNLGFSGRDMRLKFLRGNNTWGFNINYKWVQGFIFEGSPQFTGKIPTYDQVDAQINCVITKIHTTLKLGASNLLNNKQFQTYGGPRIGRMAYVSVLYDFVKR